MGIIYSFVSDKKEDKEKYLKVLRKGRRDLGDIGRDENMIFAIDEDTKRIISFIKLAEPIHVIERIHERLDHSTSPREYDEEKEKVFDIFEFFVEDKYIDMEKEIISNMISIATNIKPNITISWPEPHMSKLLKSIGFVVAEDKRYHELQDRIKEAKEKIDTTEGREKEFWERELEYYLEKLDGYSLIYKNETGKKIVNGYVEFDKLPAGILDIPQVEYPDPHVFRTDDKYIWSELRKDDELYGPIINQIQDEITEPNLRENGGTLYGFTGLFYPELIVYLKDKETHKIVGYEGLTKHYGIGLYISQIAVRNDYKHKGIGSLMVEEAIKRTNEENIDILSADISYDNEYSLALFKKFGFVNHIGKRFLLNVKEYTQEDEINNTHKRS